MNPITTIDKNQPFNFVSSSPIDLSCALVNRNYVQILHADAAEDVEFVRKLQDLKVTQIPGRVQFECEVSRRDVEVTWMKGSKVIRLSDGKYELIKEGRIHQLVIKEVDGRDDGEYRVECRNKCSRALLSVHG